MRTLLFTKTRTSVCPHSPYILQRRLYKQIASKVSTGDVIDHKGRDMECIKGQQFHHAQGKGIVAADLKDVTDGRRLEVKWRSKDDVEVVELESKRMKYVGVSGDDPDVLEFEERGGVFAEIEKDLFGSKAAYLFEGCEIIFKQIEDEVLSFSFVDPYIECVVKDTPIGGGQVQPTPKIALLTNGIKVKVPPFVQNGNKIVVNADTNEYQSKA